jgi:Holliday junction resolvase RusA-like endonuclease
VLPSKSSADWETMAVNEMLRIRSSERNKYRAHPVRVCALFYLANAIKGDLTGYMQALADAMQTAKVIENDKQIESWDGSRRLLDRANPRVEVTVELFEEDGK